MNNADEIVRALQICNRSKGHRCSECPVFSQYPHRSCKKTVDKLASDLIETLQADLARVTAERDAAVADIPVAHDAGRCEVCKHKRNDGACKKWPDRSCFQWRGLQQAGEERA